MKHSMACELSADDAGFILPRRFKMMLMRVACIALLRAIILRKLSLCPPLSDFSRGNHFLCLKGD